MKGKKAIMMASLASLIVLSAIIVPSNAAAQKKILLGYAGWYLADPFQAALQKQTIIEADKNGVAYLQPTDSRADAAKQFTDIQTLIGQGANVIITMPSDAQAIVPAIKYAKSMNVPVVTIDMAPDGESAYMTVRADNIKMGEIAAEWVGKTLKGKGKVLDLQGELTNSNGRDRTNGFEKYMASHYPGITVVGRPTKWQTELASNAAQTVLSTDPNIDAVFMQSDAIMLASVLNVLQSLNKATKVGEPGHIYLISVDGTPFALDKIRSDELDACVSQPLDLYCKFGIKYAIDAVKGVRQVVGPTDHNSKISYTLGALQDQLTSPLITKQNVDDPMLWGNMVK
jgi:ABC-type sugar transport system substrate-binding protein